MTHMQALVFSLNSAAAPPRESTWCQDSVLSTSPGQIQSRLPLQTTYSTSEERCGYSAGDSVACTVLSSAVWNVVRIVQQVASQVVL